MKKTKVTIALLRSMGAGCPGIAEFERVFPQGAEITLENCIKAAEERLNIVWFARSVLTDLAREEFNKAADLAYAEFNKATAPALATYHKATAPIFERDEKYLRVIDTTWAEYLKVVASAFWEVNQVEG